MTPLEAYEQLEAQEKRLSALSGASAILYWDKAVMMPPGGIAARAEQLAELGLAIHETQTDPARADLIATAGEGNGELNDWQRANLREVERRFRRATALPADLVAAKTRIASATEMAWREAREIDDFDGVAGKLENLIAIVREEASCLGEAIGVDPYDALLDGFEPGLKEKRVEDLFTDLLQTLPSLLDEIIAAQAGMRQAPIEGVFPVDQQESLSRGIMKGLGFNFNHGRLDVSHHPFTGGVPDDSRITTRYVDDDFFQALMATIHETGHSLYESGLPEKWRDQPVGKARGMVMHESQSLFFEMQAGRSPDFIRFLRKAALKAFGGNSDAWSEAAFLAAYHKVKKGLIRVYADEVSYPLHVMLRFDLERALLNGDLLVADLPTAWNDDMQAKLGITPSNNRDGCMQDIHWYSGAFGYFPTYTLGALAAAQLFAAATISISNIDKDLTNGDFSQILPWLRENVHKKASRYSTDEILKQATGATLGPNAFLKHLRSRYLA